MYEKTGNRLKYPSCRSKQYTGRELNYQMSEVKNIGVNYKMLNVGK